MTMQTKPPVVTVMGHVDHGKTTLLDYIRKTNAATREAGGITQSIGAYEIIHYPDGSRMNADLDADKRGSNISENPRSNQRKSANNLSSGGRKITFIDTPGHEAFTKMRSAGAAVADLAILVVAAEEGIKPQTKEAIAILAETKTPFIVAINKIDKEPNLERTKKELAEAGVLLEGYGGQVSFHGVSAKTGEGVNDLLDLTLLTAEMEHLTYSPEKNAAGFILETRMDQRRGLEVTAIIKDGMLRAGDAIGTATAKGKVRILENFLGKTAKELAPSAPALIIGFETMPKVGETFTTGAEMKTQENAAVSEPKVKIPASGLPSSEKNPLRLILKAADSGSLEALSLIVQNLKTEKQPKVLAESVGDINDGDVKLAVATGAIIIGFKTRVNAAAKNLSDAQRVIIITSEIIYDLVKTVEEALKKPEDLNILGDLEILAIFNQEKQEKQLVGGRVIKGIVRNKGAFEIVREEKVAGRGRIINLQSQKKDAGQVGEGGEAGFIANAEILMQIGDHIVMRK